MTNWKKKVNPISFQSMEDMQDLMEQNYILLHADELDRDSLRLNLDAMAEAASISLEDAAFHCGEQSA